jgi:hypothetical protein
MSLAGGSVAIDFDRLDRLGQVRIGAGQPVGHESAAVPGNAGPRQPGSNRIAELLNSAGSACPSLRRPPKHSGALTVTVAFVVDTGGAVDPATLRVLESPDRPQTEHRFYSHIYAVAGSATVDAGLRDVGAAYDSVVTAEVVVHVARLEFRPALTNDRPIRSGVVVSCQSP